MKNVFIISFLLLPICTFAMDPQKKVTVACYASKSKTTTFPISITIKYYDFDESVWTRFELHGYPNTDTESKKGDDDEIPLILSDGKKINITIMQFLYGKKDKEDWLCGILNIPNEEQKSRIKMVVQDSLVIAGIEKLRQSNEESDKKDLEKTVAEVFMKARKKS